MRFLGIDWGEHHHDLCLLDQDGRVLAAHRIADGLAGAGELHALVAAHAQDPAQVAVGSRPTGACWSALCWPLVTRCMRSTRRWWAATAAATRSRGLSRTAGMPRCWPIWFALTGTTTAR